MKICVLGGSGFLGSHVCDELSKGGHEVRIFDIKESVWSTPSQEMIVGNLLDIKSLNKAIQGCEVVYNLAGLSDLDYGLEDAQLAAELNILGSIHSLNASIAQSVKRYIYASTVYVYSEEGGFYRCSKQAAELFIEQYQKQYGLEFTVLRFGSLYGPRSDSRNGMYRIIKRAIDDGIVGYKGNSDSTREYIHVEDAASASVEAMRDEFLNKHVVLTGQDVTHVKDLLLMIREIMGIKKEIEFTGPPERGHYVRTPYSYRSTVGRKYVSPMHVDLGQGLLQLIEYVSEVES